MGSLLPANFLSRYSRHFIMRFFASSESASLCPCARTSASVSKFILPGEILYVLIIFTAEARGRKEKLKIIYVSLYSVFHKGDVEIQQESQACVFQSQIGNDLRFMHRQKLLDRLNFK